MSASTEISEHMPVVRTVQEFDAGSGNTIERLVFNHRFFVIVFCVIATLALGFSASRLAVNASFERMLPRSQPYIKNYLDNKEALRGLGNAVRISVENTRGTIYDANYLQVLQKINDTTFLIPGVDRSFMKSLWTPALRWTQITEEGYRGGPVMPDDYDGSPAAISRLAANVGRAGLVGSFVSNDQKSSMLYVPLIDVDPQTGKPLDYAAFSHALKEKIQSMESDSIRIHVVGFAELTGVLIDGLVKVMAYFAIAAVIASSVIFFYSRCIRSTALVVTCSLTAVVWQLGLANLLGLELDPYLILVPFLVFAIGVSHGAQKMNGIMQDVARGTHQYVAARYTFRRLFLAGLTALVADAVGFAVLGVIDIPVIRDLALTASIGVGVLVFTNLLLLPVILSYIGVSKKAAARSLRADSNRDERHGIKALWALLERFTERRWATGAVVVWTLLAVGGFVVSQRLQVGDLDPGAPELRADSRYNRDVKFIADHFGLSSDVFAVIVKTPPDHMATFQTLLEEDRLEQKLRALPVVQGTESAARQTRFSTSGMNEGSPKWLSINRDKAVVSQATFDLVTNDPELINSPGTNGAVIAYLTDHKATTLRNVASVADEFASTHSSPGRQFLLAGGSAGIEAATNIAVADANRTMLFLVYGAVTILCFVTFRNWRAVLVAMIPLAITSILCEALMVFIGIGVKVATLPVVALGVGIGVDYALYLLSVQIAQQRAGLPLRDAYRNTLAFTGKVVGLVGVTLAAGVCTWAWSPIKFQADMGILLTFMFVWNMIGALVMIPALSHFLLQGASRKCVDEDAARPELVQRGVN